MENEVRDFILSLISPLIGRVDKLEAGATDVQVWQAKYGERIDTIYKLVEDLSGKPQKRWETVIASIISAVAVAVVAMLLK